MRLKLFFLAYCCVLGAQDAGTVLGTWVSYRTQAGTRSLAPEIRTQVDKLQQQAMAANAFGNHRDAMRLLAQGMALMNGLDWNATTEYASALTPKADKVIWQPGDAVRLGFTTLWDAKASPEQKLAGVLLLRMAPGQDPLIRQEFSINSAADKTELNVPTSLAAGSYRLEVEFAVLKQPRVVAVAVEPGIRAQLDKLRTQLEKHGEKGGRAMWTARYPLEAYDRANRGEVSPARLGLSAMTRQALNILAAMDAGTDYLSARTGDLHLAYLSPVDQTLQPYRLYIPSSYKGDKPFPLVVALHGMGGDENSLLDGYGRPVFQEQADLHGYIVVAPKGRDPASMYRGAAEKDVLDVLDQVRSNYKIDPDRVYLTGHSMGAYGTWSVAINHPDLFAALAPVSGGGTPADVVKIRHIPQLVVHGDADKTVLIEQSRAMVAAAKKLGTEVKLVEVPGGGHIDVFVPAVPQAFEWFNQHTKKKPAAAAAATGALE